MPGILQRLRHATGHPASDTLKSQQLYNGSPALPLIRPSREEDVATITAIYRHHVLTGTGTFEIEPPTEADMATRRADVLSKGCLLYTSPSPRDRTRSRMPSSA